MDVAETILAADLAPRSKQKCSVTLRNWTAKPRSWKAAADQPWIIPDKASGDAAAGTQAATVTLDGFAVEAGKESKGTLTITDSGTGFSYPVQVSANVRPIFQVSLERAVFNISIGEKEDRGFALINNSGADFKWKSSSSVPWITAKPASGILSPFKAIQVAIECRPPDKVSAMHDTTVTMGEDGGGLSREIKIKTYVIPPYKKPSSEPQGEAVSLEAQHFKSHEILAFTTDRRSDNWMWHNDLNKPRLGETMSLYYDAGGVDLKRLDQPLVKALWVRPHHVSVLKLEGSGFKAFSTYVGFPKGMDRADFHRDAEVYFEIYLDGKLAVQSGKVVISDPPRLLVADNLGATKELMLVCRLAGLKDSPKCLVFWGDPKFYK